MSSVVEVSHGTSSVVTTEAKAALVSDDAERAVLGALLIAGAADDHRLGTRVATVLTPAMFARGAHRTVYEAMETLRRQRVTVDPLTLMNQLQADGTLGAAGGKEFVAALLDEVPTPDHAVHHAEIVRERWKRREVRQLAIKMRQMAEDPTVGIDQVFSWASRSLLPLTATAGEQGFRLIKAGLYETMERIEGRRRGEASTTLIPTGLPELDDRLSGGTERGQLIVVAGVPSCGKTSIVWNILRDVTESGHGAVAFVSAEMTLGMLLENALAAEGDVSRGNIKKGELSREEWARLGAAAARLLQQKIYVDDTVMPDIEDVVNRCRLLKAKEPTLCAIGVDFIQLLQKGDRDRGELQSAILTHITYRLKSLALELGVVVFALAQPNDKQIEDRPDKRPQLRDLQGSAGIRQAADHVWLLYRDRMYNASAADRIEINVAKQKDGSTGTAILDWDGPRLRVVSPRRRELELQAARVAAIPPELQLEKGDATE